MNQPTVSMVMHREVVTARPGTTLLDAATSMYTHGINGLPVVDASDRVVGVVGIKDILRVPFRSSDEVYISTATPFSRIVMHLQTLCVQDVMAIRPICASPDEPVGSLLASMINRGIHPIPVVDEERHLLGIVGRADVLGALLRPEAAIEQSYDNIATG